MSEDVEAEERAPGTSTSQSRGRRSALTAPVGSWGGSSGKVVYGTQGLGMPCDALPSDTTAVKLAHRVPACNLGAKFCRCLLCFHVFSPVLLHGHEAANPAQEFSQDMVKLLNTEPVDPLKPHSKLEACKGQELHMKGCS